MPLRRHAAHPAPPGDAVLVTGASSGMGRDAALHLNGLGYRVFGTVRSDHAADELRGAAPVPAMLHPVRLDVTRDEQFAAALQQVTEHLAGGRLAGLFSNAGIALYTGDLSCERCPLETQQRVMDTNFFGAVRTVRTFLPLLREARGTIVFNSAMMARIVLPYNAGYAASKCALEGWADALRREVGHTGVRVVLLECGAMATEIDSHMDPAAVPADPPYEAQRRMVERATASMARMGRPPRVVSDIVVRAIQSERPPTRVRAGGGHRTLHLLSRLPDRAQDRLLGRLVG